MVYEFRIFHEVLIRILSILAKTLKFAFFKSFMTIILWEVEQTIFIVMIFIALLAAQFFAYLAEHWVNCNTKTYMTLISLGQWIRKLGLQCCRVNVYDLLVEILLSLTFVVFIILKFKYYVYLPFHWFNFNLLLYIMMDSLD